VKHSSVGMSGNCRGGEQGVDAEHDGVGSLEHDGILVLMRVARLMVCFCACLPSTSLGVVIWTAMLEAVLRMEAESEMASA
jgi:hypothetical protein